MRIALLSYRSKTHCGGQGVYVRHLSCGLVELGHDVEVFSGQPYPEGLDPRVRLTKVPSLDLYREPDPFRISRPREIKTGIDVLELLTTWTAGFPEPRTFSMRAARILAERRRRQAMARGTHHLDRRGGHPRCRCTLVDDRGKWHLPRRGSAARSGGRVRLRLRYQRSLASVLIRKGLVR